jgi:two-component system alkaline phosphatase synthesis response regulator PhoP
MKQTEQQRILIVEDDVHIAEGLKLNLTLQGYEAAIACSGTAGLKMWKEWNPQLIVLDIMLPGMDGWSVLRHIRLEEERLPILIRSRVFPSASMTISPNPSTLRNFFYGSSVC